MTFAAPTRPVTSLPGRQAPGGGRPRVACIGECMVELRERPDGHLSRSWGGDTLNTAIYLSRLGVDVDYVTALGDDAWSDEMVVGWTAEGVGTSLVERLPGRVPGLYVIQTDERGERRFSYWRDSAPARDLFALPGTERIAASLARHAVLYLSGISLSLYGQAGRERLFDVLAGCRAAGARVAFDTNFRPRGWPDRQEAAAVFRRAMAIADTLFASSEDLGLVFGPDGERAFHEAEAASERVLKLAEPACRVIADGVDEVVASVPVDPVDTTAAGDSFAAAFLAARLAGEGPVAAARAGHRLAGAVVLHPGAIIPRSAMPLDLMPHDLMPQDPRFEAAPSREMSA